METRGEAQLELEHARLGQHWDMRCHVMDMQGTRAAELEQRMYIRSLNLL